MKKTLFLLAFVAVAINFSISGNASALSVYCPTGTVWNGYDCVNNNFACTMIYVDPSSKSRNYDRCHYTYYCSYDGFYYNTASYCKPLGYYCWNGNYYTNPNFCPAQKNYKCWDGTWVVYSYECPTRNNNTNTCICWNGYSYYVQYGTTCNTYYNNNYWYNDNNNNNNYNYNYNNNYNYNYDYNYDYTYTWSSSWYR